MMKCPVFITILFCCVTLIVPAQNRRTGNTNWSTRQTTNQQNRSTNNQNRSANPRQLEVPFIPAGVFSAQELEDMRLNTLNEIETTSLLLNETNNTTKTVLNRLNLLTQQLLSRKKIIAILGEEIVEIDRKIKTMTDEIELLNKDLEKTKENYAKSMQNQRQEYLTTQHKMLLILSAENLAQSYRRMRYLREYADWQKKEAERIGEKQTEIVHRKTELEESRQEKQNLLAQRENENKKMVTEEQHQQKEVRDLNNKQRDLQQLIDQKKKEADALNRQIDNLILEDIKYSERNRTSINTESKAPVIEKSETETGEVMTTESITSETISPETVALGNASPNRTTTGTAATGSYVLLESETALSKEFASNKGKLPVPLTGQYSIVSAFGEHQHQDLTYVRTNNNGIDIQTTAGADARAIFRGVVTRVFMMPGFNNNVIIRHGDYLTVYSNLSNVLIKQGDIVSANQIIGKIFTDIEKGNETILHFQLWNERTKLNPATWIR